MTVLTELNEGFDNYRETEVYIGQALPVCKNEIESTIMAGVSNREESLSVCDVLRPKHDLVQTLVITTDH